MGGSKKPLDRAALLAAAKRRTIEVEVDRLEAPVRLMELSVSARNLYARPFVEAELKGTELDVDQVLALRGDAVGRSLVDENDARLFSDDDLALIGDFPSDVLDTLWEHVDRLNGLTKETIKEIEGN